MNFERSIIEKILSEIGLTSSDYYIDDLDDERTTYCIFDILLLSFDETNSLAVSFYIDSLEETDNFCRFCDEFFILLLYAYIKKRYSTPSIDVDESWPYTRFTLSIRIKTYSEEDIRNCIYYARSLLDEYLILLNLSINNNKFEEAKSAVAEVIRDVKNNLWEIVSISDFLFLSNSLTYLKCLHRISAFGFNPLLFDANDMSKKLCKVDCTNRSGVQLQLEFTEYSKQAIPDQEVCTLLNLQKYLLVTSHETIYIVENDGYMLLKQICEDLYERFNVESDINGFVSQDHILTLQSDLFTVTQAAYIAAPEFTDRIFQKEIASFKEQIDNTMKKRLFNRETVVEDFKRLIDNKDTSERQIEKFIRDHYQVIFGNKYNKIHTQVVVTSGDGESERRLDVLLHDSITDDWEVVELKKASIKLTRNVRGVYQLCADITTAIAQIRNYSQIMQLTEVKEYLKGAYDIEYKSLEFRLIVGNEFSDSFRQCISNEKDIKIQTYKLLYDDAKSRLII